MSDKEAGHLTKEEIDAALPGISGSRYSIVQEKGKPDEAFLLKAFAAQPNIPALVDKSENCGYFNAFPDSDGVIRWSPLAIRLKDDFYMPLSIGLVLQYMDWPMIALQVSDLGIEGVRIGDIEVPTDESGRILINYVGPAKSFPHYSITDIVNGRLAPELFRDKIVIVGATAVGIFDLRVTPFSTVYPGIEIHANVIDNILSRNFIQRPAWTGLFDISAVILIGLLIGFILPRLRALAGMGLSIGILCRLCSTELFHFRQIQSLAESYLSAADRDVGLPRDHGV